MEIVAHSAISLTPTPTASEVMHRRHSAFEYLSPMNDEFRALRRASPKGINRLWNRATPVRLRPENVDVVELHDCFSANELITYEALGPCGEGKAGEFIDAGANTYGGTGRCAGRRTSVR
jgi:acetyl-CoA acetyltransferase